MRLPFGSWGAYRVRLDNLDTNAQVTGDRALPTGSLPVRVECECFRQRLRALIAGTRTARNDLMRNDVTISGDDHRAQTDGSTAVHQDRNLHGWR